MILLSKLLIESLNFTECIENLYKNLQTVVHFSFLYLTLRIIVNN